MIRVDFAFDENRYMLPEEHKRWLQLKQTNSPTPSEQNEKHNLELTAQRRYLDDVHQMDSLLKSKSPQGSKNA